MSERAKQIIALVGAVALPIARAVDEHQRMKDRVTFAAFGIGAVMFAVFCIVIAIMSR